MEGRRALTEVTLPFEDANLKFIDVVTFADVDYNFTIWTTPKSYSKYS